MSDNSFWGNFNAMQKDTVERAKRLEKFFNRDTSFDEKAYFQKVNPFANAPVSTVSQGPVKPAQVDLIAQEQADKKKYLQEAIQLGLSGDALKQYIKAKMQPVVAPPTPPKADKVVLKELSTEERAEYMKALDGAFHAEIDDPDEFARQHIIDFRKSQLDKKRAASPDKADAKAARKKARKERREALRAKQEQFKNLGDMIDDNTFNKNKFWKDNCFNIEVKSVQPSGNNMSVPFARRIETAHAAKWGYPAFALLTFSANLLKPWEDPDANTLAIYESFLTNELELPADYAGEDLDSL
jgi:YesN/AraC family two-component response regulator